MAARALLVTGAAGFIGARFVESCNRRGVPLVSVDRLASFVDRPEHRGLDFGARVDVDGLDGWLAAEAPGLAGIVHLGACTDTTEMDLDHLRRVNLEYSQRLWRWASAHRVPFVYASSAATYGDGANGYDDDEASIPKLRPLNPYGESKQRFDLWALGEEGAGRTPPAWSGFKFFNVYGFGERHKGKMASVILHAYDQIRADGEVRLFKSYRPDVADGEQRRDFVHVEDVVAVLWFALERPLARGIFNLGSGASRSFLDLARATFAALGVPPRIRFIEMPESLRARYQYATEARMDRVRGAGWTTPFTTLEEGARRYVARLLAEA
ncbi:MAG: ADP-glyceromanno-heptose 6-epimerase [Deltaproteobacteria bacterium]|nr:ADP-glyceromanno-heptose 6-epimerase [Deltaproteobacteria bacterium]